MYSQIVFESNVSTDSRFIRTDLVDKFFYI